MLNSINSFVAMIIVVLCIYGDCYFNFKYVNKILIEDCYGIVYYFSLIIQVVTINCIEMDELDPQKIFNKIIFKELDPSVINEEIIRETVYEQGPSGEAGRLFREMEVQYEKVTVLRLEFLSKSNKKKVLWKYSLT